MPGPRGTLKERLLRRIVEDENGCWIWQGARTGKKRPYGQIRLSKAESPALVHRVAYELFVGPIPVDEDGKTLFVDHLCYDSEGYSNTLCCNPEHLEPVTDLINKRRGYVPKKAAGWKHYKQKNNQSGEVE